MIANRPKAEIIAELNGAQGERTIQNVLKLLEMLISEARIDMDTAVMDGVLTNQGKIRGYQILQDHILKGLPSTQKKA